MNRRALLRSGSAALLAVRPLSSFAAAQPTSGVVHPDFRVRFVRHAESQINVLRTIDVPGEPLPPDSGVTYPLTQLGVEQAIALGKKLHDDPIVEIHTSPRLRATQTADAIAFAHAIPIELAPGLVEVAFTDPADSMSTVDYVAVAQTLTNWILGNADARAPGGESLTEVLDRFLPAVQAPIARLSGQPVELVFVSHSITLAIALPALFPNLVRSWTLLNVLPNAAVATGAPVDGVLVCTDWNGAPPG